MQLTCPVCHSPYNLVEKAICPVCGWQFYYFFQDPSVDITTRIRGYQLQFKLVYTTWNQLIQLKSEIPVLEKQARELNKEANILTNAEMKKERATRELRHLEEAINRYNHQPKLAEKAVLEKKIGELAELERRNLSYANQVTLLYKLELGELTIKLAGPLPPDVTLPQVTLGLSNRPIDYVKEASLVLMIDLKEKFETHPLRLPLQVSFAVEELQRIDWNDYTLALCYERDLKNFKVEKMP